VAITNYCRAQGIPIHLDGARLYMMSAATGISPQQYAAHFDTVYVSLYKYFGAPFGAILAGSAVTLHDLYHDRRMFGGGLPSASLAAALALHGAETFVARFAEAMRQGVALIDRLNTLPGIRVERFAHGSNIFPVLLDPTLALEPFLATLHQHNVFLFANNGASYLTINTTILRQPNDAIVAAFAAALEAGQYQATHV
jgi:threonine aldolase